MGIEEQFGFQPERSTADVQFIIKNALQTKRAHGLSTYILFVDLVKAFDTANRDLIYTILAKYGALAELISAIERLHTHFHLEFKLDKKNKCLIENSIGVKQGDNVAGVLFLLMIQAVAQMWKKKLTHEQRWHLYSNIMRSARIRMDASTANPHRRQPRGLG